MEAQERGNGNSDFEDEEVVRPLENKRAEFAAQREGRRWGVLPCLNELVLSSSSPDSGPSCASSDSGRESSSLGQLGVWRRRSRNDSEQEDHACASHEHVDSGNRSAASSGADEGFQTPALSLGSPQACASPSPAPSLSELQGTPPTVVRIHVVGSGDHRIRESKPASPHLDAQQTRLKAAATVASRADLVQGHSVSDGGVVEGREHENVDGTKTNFLPGMRHLPSSSDAKTLDESNGVTTITQVRRQLSGSCAPTLDDQAREIETVTTKSARADVCYGRQDEAVNVPLQLGECEIFSDLARYGDWLLGASSSELHREFARAGLLLPNEGLSELTMIDRLIRFHAQRRRKIATEDPQTSTKRRLSLCSSNSVSMPKKKVALMEFALDENVASTREGDDPVELEDMAEAAPIRGTKRGFSATHPTILESAPNPQGDQQISVEKDGPERGNEKQEDATPMDQFAGMLSPTKAPEASSKVDGAWDRPRLLGRRTSGQNDSIELSNSFQVLEQVAHEKSGVENLSLEDRELGRMEDREALNATPQVHDNLDAHVQEMSKEESDVRQSNRRGKKKRGRRGNRGAKRVADLSDVNRSKLGKLEKQPNRGTLLALTDEALRALLAANGLPRKRNHNKAYMVSDLLGHLQVLLERDSNAELKLPDGVTRCAHSDRPPSPPPRRPEPQLPSTASTSRQPPPSFECSPPSQQAQVSKRAARALVLSSSSVLTTLESIGDLLAKLKAGEAIAGLDWLSLDPLIVESISTMRGVVAGLTAGNLERDISVSEQAAPEPVGHSGLGKGQSFAAAAKKGPVQPQVGLPARGFGEPRRPPPGWNWDRVVVLQPVDNTCRRETLQALDFGKELDRQLTTQCGCNRAVLMVRRTAHGEFAVLLTDEGHAAAKELASITVPGFGTWSRTDEARSRLAGGSFVLSRVPPSFSPTKVVKDLISCNERRWNGVSEEALQQIRIQRLQRKISPSQWAPSSAVRVFAPTAICDIVLKQGGVVLDFEWIPARTFNPAPRRCFVCGRTGHMAKYCRNQPRCRHCGGAHETILCGEPLGRERDRTNNGRSNGRTAPST